MTAHIYIHIPFCARPCPYCAFYKSPLRDTDTFIEALLREARERATGIRPQTIFIGGGTPTILKESQLARLCNGLREAFDCSAVSEWTVEMNPATVSAKKADTLLALGINRASLGVQSWNDRHLRTLGRIHTATQALESHRILATAGFRNINMDFIFAIPGQTLDDWRHTLEETIALAPTHVSTYALTYEEDTEFFRRLGAQTNPLEPEMFDLAVQFLTAAGLPPYETSNFAREGYECRHNRAIWHGADYLGLGPSATSTIARQRRKNIADVAVYVSSQHERGTAAQGSAGVSPAVASVPLATPEGETPSETGQRPVLPVRGFAAPPFDTPDISELSSSAERVHALFETEHLSEEALRIERIALGLRTREGIPATLAAPHKIAPLLAAGLLVRTADRLALTPRARPLADAVIAEII